MAKKKATPKVKPKNTLRPGMTVISMKVMEEFRNWLADLADSERITSVQMIERALVEYAERRKFKPAPRRTEGR